LDLKRLRFGCISYRITQYDYKVKRENEGGPMVIVYLSKREIRVLGLLLGLGCLVGMIVYQYQTVMVQSWLGRITVAVDPGHGGVDGGAQDCQGNLEKDINLAIGLAVEKQLRQSGLTVVMTRRTDTDLAPFHSGQSGRHRRDLNRRIEIARQNRCQCLVSIHCDASEATRKKGAFVFYNWRSSLSRNLAEAIQHELNQVQARPGKIAPGKYLVIRQEGLPGVLVEVGYLSNQEERQLLQNRSYQAKIGLAITRGILGFIKRQPAPRRQFKVIQSLWQEFSNLWIRY
jgi:N-acetylmuramoyl-L-alanine amidase